MAVRVECPRALTCSRISILGYITKADLPYYSLSAEVILSQISRLQGSSGSIFNELLLARALKATRVGHNTISGLRGFEDDLVLVALKATGVGHRTISGLPGRGTAWVRS